MKISGTAIVCDHDVDFELEGDNVVFNCNFNELEKLTSAKRDEHGNLYFDGSEHINETYIKGKTTNGRFIYFYVAMSSVDCFRARIICNLYSYYISKFEFSCNAITIYGGDISIIVRNYNEHNINPSKDSIVISFKSNKTYHDVTFKDKTKIKFACYDSFITRSRDKNPIEYVGVIQLIIPATGNIKDFFDYIELSRQFVSYLCFRKDIVFDKVLLGTYNNKTRRVTNEGEYYICNNPEIISVSSIKNKRFIPFNLINRKTSTIIRMIKDNRLYMHHLRDGHKRIHSISGGDVVTLTAGFEYEFDASKIRIPPKPKVKAQIEYLLSRYNSILRSDKINSFGRSTVKNAKKHIDDLMLETKLNWFFKNIPAAFTSAIEKIYKYRDLVFKASEAARRISDARNNFAHGLIKNNFSIEIIYDFLVLEMILYFIQLKRVGITDDDAYLCVCLLFNLDPDL